MNGTRWALAIFHLLALAIGLGAVWARGRALRKPLDAAGLHALLYADNWWGIAALLWIITGLWRAFGGVEKGTHYYLSNPVFHAKLTLFAVIFLLELAPMIALIKLRVGQKRGATLDAKKAAIYAKISFVQAGIVVLIVILATALARGFRW